MKTNLANYKWDTSQFVVLPGIGPKRDGSWGWIAVTEKKPKPGQYVLTYSPDHKKGYAHKNSVAKYDRCPYDRRRMKFLMDNTLSLALESASHWMPLPARPLPLRLPRRRA